MPKHIVTPTIVEAAGNLPKRIEEYVGRVNSGHGAVSRFPAASTIIGVAMCFGMGYHTISDAMRCQVSVADT